MSSSKELRVECLGPLDVRLRMPTSAILIGPSGSGKTTFMGRLLKLGKTGRDFFDDSRAFKNHVVLFYNVNQPTYAKWKEEDLVHSFYNVTERGIPEQSMIREMAEPYTGKGGIVFIFDDVQSYNSCLESLFTVHRQHNVISTFILTQHVFRANNAYYKNMCRNAQLIVLFRCIRNSRAVRAFASEFDEEKDGKVNYFYEAYKLAISRNPAYGYLYYDASQKSPEMLRKRTNVLPDMRTGKICQTVFIKKKDLVDSEEEEAEEKGGLGKRARARPRSWEKKREEEAAKRRLRKRRREEGDDE